MERDPVCGMEVDPKSVAGSMGRLEWQGTTYYFCSAACLKQFQQSPERYVKK